MTSTEGLKKEIDSSRNEKLETQEMEEFLKSEENIKKLGEAMNSNSSPELLQELENTLKDLCDKILSQTEISENQQKILDYFLDKFGEKYPEIKEKATKIIDIRALEEEISMAVETLLNNPLSNLEDLGINTKKSQFNWKNLLNDIKTIEDVEKINESTITKYLKISPNIPQENYAYIANNVKTIIKRHLEVNPKYQSILGGQSSHMTIETTVKNNEYLANLYNNVKSFIENPKNNETVQIDNIVGKINKGDQSSLQFVNLWLNMYLGDKKEEEQNKIVDKIFDKFPSTNPEKFLNACNNDKALGNLKDRYMLYWLYKENTLLSIKDKNGSETNMLDFSKKNKFIKFKGKGREFFDKVYEYTQQYYNELKKLRIDESIPFIDIKNFLNILTTKQEENKNLDQKAREVSKSTMNTAANAFVPVHAQLKQVRNASDPYDEKIKNNCIIIEEKYAALLLKSENKPRGKIQGISGSNLTLDFSKGNNPKDIVRDNFGEKLSDSWNEFKYNLSNDRKAAVGGATGMIAGIVASGASCVSGNIWAAAGAFTLASRGVNGVTQEALNGLQALYELNPGHEKTKGGNQVNNFGDSFMRGIGAYEPIIDKNTGQPILDKDGKIQYQFIGWDRFGSNLTFDYLGGVAMFGAFKALGPSFEAIKSVKIAGKPLEFASKWLFVQNFGIDMPMNALHKGTDVFLGIGDKQQKYHGSFLYGHNNGGEDAEGNEYYKSGNIGDAFEAMLGNMEEHMSLNNQSQVLFSTLLYCGMLEAGQGLASKMKSYMPATRIEKYETSSKKFQEAQKDFVSEISKKGLKLNEKFELVNAKTGKKIGALEFLEFKLPLLKLKGVLAEHTKATQELVASEKELSGDGSKTYGLLKEMGLLSDKQPPLNILKEKLIEAKKQYQEAIEAGDIKKAQDLKEIILDHQSTQITLISEFHPDAINNINLSSEERIQKAKELLQSELTAEQEQAILDAHNAPGDAYSLSIPELRAKSKILFKAGFTEAQVRTLIENCICGKMKGVKIEEGKGNEETKENTNENKTNVERLEELGIKIPEDSKELVNKMELDFEIIGNQNINSISPSDFEKLVDSHIEFPKYLITPELINKLLDTKNVGESRILIENFSKNNDADLFNSILKKREEKIIENINCGNGFISKYEQLATDLEYFEYNKNNIDEFRKMLEKHNNEIPLGYKDYLIEVFPSKLDIEGTIAYLKSMELSDIIIDYHFNDISYNVFLDIKELLNFQLSNGITIPIEHLKIYRDILNIDILPTKEKIKLHNELKNKNVIEMFYDDYSNSRDRMYQEIAYSILNKEKLEQFKDNKLSEQHGISVYKFDGQDFFALERESTSNGRTANTGATKGFSFSLVGKDCIGTRNSKSISGKKPVNAFIYEGLNPQSIMHVYPKDSWTNSGYQPWRNDNKRHHVGSGIGQIACTLMSPTELLKATQEYNEIFVLRNGDDGHQYQSIGEMKPIALYCYDEITPGDIELAKQENVGIMLIKTDAYKKNSVNPKSRENFLLGDYSYIDGKDLLDDAIYRRDVLTTFDKLNELDNVIERNK